MKGYTIPGMFFLFIFVFTFACKTDRKTGEGIVNLDSIDIDEPKNVLVGFDTVGEGLPIFYNMYLSVDMATMFKAAGAAFNDDLLNAPDRSSDYITSSKKALNLGVFAVDLSYCRVFEQYETAGRYFNAMQKLAEELGIPSDHFVNTAKRFDRNFTNKDSLIAIANEVYVTTDKYLRDNEQFSAAAQIILGGWTEAMHVAFNVAKASRNIDIIERIAEQKSSLANLIEMLSKYSHDEAVEENLNKLRALQKAFDLFVVKVDASFDEDSESGRKAIDDYLVKMTELQKIVNQMRKGMIS